MNFFIILKNNYGYLCCMWFFGWYGRKGMIGVLGKKNYSGN